MPENIFRQPKGSVESKLNLDSLSLCSVHRDVGMYHHVISLVHEDETK